MQRGTVNFTKRYSKEAEDIEGKFLEKTRKNSSDKLNAEKTGLIFDKNSSQKGNFKDGRVYFSKKVVDFNAINTQMNQKNTTQAKTVMFQNSSAVPLNEFKSLLDLKDFLKSFETRNFSSDALKLKQIGMQTSEIFLGEYQIEKTEPVDFIWNNTSYAGILIITNYRFIFWPKEESLYESVRLQPTFFKVPLMHIDKVLKSSDRKSNLVFPFVEIITKDYRNFLFRFPGEINAVSAPNQPIRPCEKIYQLFLSCSIPRFREIYAAQFAFHLKSLDEEHLGWDIYNLKDEFKRQGLEIVYNPMDKEASNLRWIDNNNGRICSTYPFALVMPLKMTDEAVQKSAAFRSRERLPVLTFCYHTKVGNNKMKVYLWRASQCKSGITQRCPDDELLLRFLGERPDGGSFLKIFDARPYLNAMANKLDGKGYENTSNYRNADLRFLGIHNIQKVRDAFRKVCVACYCTDEEKWFAQIESWFSLLSHILSGALEIVVAMKKGYNCLIHCSDGWDRTSQLLSLIQIMLDPYFRTIKGFMVLVEKEWISFGHQFAFRSGHSKNINDDQKSPIFVQFLDCVHQIMNQYPLSFEFNTSFLVDIAYHVYSCYFGTFLYDTVLERSSYQTQERTLSLWSFILASKEKYLNSYYKAPEDLQIRELCPSVSRKFLRLWKEFFLRYSMEAKDKYNSHGFTEDVLMQEYSFMTKENVLLRQEISKIKQESPRKNENPKEKNEPSFE